eukprot:CAMPEP_0195095576 /NCGR_PEP_ID=MMETSP0448-20130528/47275_1 /TAXON_ID=66468 /ORGANISM="Heterocapsa triquestra, Strain CCMP 448" /LENGTH=52 /DNA_ID=CAMNT_0040129807 /DNA_START=22 /DNA_END=177 /DNA_ORIENTATION=-
MKELFSSSAVAECWRIMPEAPFVAQIEADDGFSFGELTAFAVDGCFIGRFQP